MHTSRTSLLRSMHYYRFKSAHKNTKTDRNIPKLSR